MRICAKPSEFASLRIAVHDFGNGPMLTTERKGKTVVLAAIGGVLESCGDDGLLSPDEALPVLKRIVALWNANLDAEVNP